MNAALLWAILAAMTLAVTAALVAPLLRQRPPRGRRADFNRQIYRDQLGELDADVERGVVTAAEAEGARIEIQRRLIATADGDGEAPAAAGVPRAAALGVAVLVPAAALGVYLWLGDPRAPEPPRAAEAEAEAGPGADELDANIEKLRVHLTRQSGDLQGWLLLARSLTVVGRHGEAAAAYRRAAAIAPGNLDVKAGATEALVAASGGRVTPEARAGFREVLAARPDDPAARYYLALGKAQDGELRAAFDMWRSLLLDAPADAPWREPVAQRVRDLAARLGVDGAAVAAPPEDGGERRGPTAEEMAAAADMSPEERRRMIRGMVEGLAAQLEDEPDDAEGWRRLVRVYGVLGERQEAYAAMARAVARLPDDAGALLGAAGALMQARRSGDPVPQAAVTALRRILDIEPENPRALFHMGEVQAETGEIERARATWLGLLGRLDPGSPTHTAVKRSLERLESGG